MLSQDTAAPPAARGLHGKRRREKTIEEEVEEDTDGPKTRKDGENTSPNVTTEKTTPMRKVRGQTRGVQKLFASGADAAKPKGAGERGDFFC